MSTDDRTQFARDAAVGHFQGIQVVSAFMAGAANMLGGVIIRQEFVQRESSILGLWLRSYAWIQSLERLNHTRHVQAIAAANRALLELLVDCLLLHGDQTNVSGWRIFNWGQSERMRHAEQLMTFFSEIGEPVPQEHQAVERYFIDEKPMIDQMRRDLWPDLRDPARAVHPRRWTGRSDLFRDITEVDRQFADLLERELGCTLTAYYRSDYRQLNWQIHSGIAGFWNLPPTFFDLACAQYLQWCGDFAMMLTWVVFQDFNFGAAIPNLQAQWDAVRATRASVLLAARESNAPASGSPGDA